MLRSVISKVQNFRAILRPVNASDVYKENMKAFVNKPNGAERAEITLQYALPSGNNRTFNFNRLMTEEVGLAIDRMSENINKQVNKQLNKKKKKKNPGDLPAAIEINVKILKNGFEIPRSLPVVEAFTDDTSLVINDVAYQICVNVPKVLELSLPKSIMAGFEYFPSVMMDHGDSRSSEFEWFTEEMSPTDAAQAKPVFNWVKVSTGFSFTPNNGHVGKKLKLKCIPKSNLKEGEPVEVISECEVTPSPGFCPFMTRHSFTRKRAEGFRAVSYNILADFYADSDFSRETLFSYCPNYALHIDYRKPLFTTEIVGYNADIVCLQECDVKVFVDQLVPILDVHGLEGVMKRKGHTAEGTAVFFARDKFKMIANDDIQLSDYIKESPSMKEIHEKICQSESLKDRIESRQTSVQVVLLESCADPRHRVLVATTHLFWHPTAGHIRILQSAACLSFIQELLPKYAVDNQNPAVLFAGDFNSVPYCGASKFLSEGVITADHGDWMKGGEEEYVGGIDLQHSLKLTSACGYPQYTNYTLGFKECLDYIFITPDLEVEQVVPLPSEEELSLHTAVPNVVFPSDHLALVCDLKWK